MALSLAFHLDVMKKIKRINAMYEVNERIEAWSAVRLEVQGSINDELDDLAEQVQMRDDLDENGQRKKDFITTKDVINSLSVAASQEQQEVLDYNAAFDYMESSLNELSWYEKAIVIAYLRLGNYRAIEKDTMIPWESCYKTVQKAFAKIQAGAAKRGIHFRKPKQRKK